MTAETSAKELSAMIERLAENISAIRTDETLEDYKARMHATWLSVVAILRGQQELIEDLQASGPDGGR